MKRKGDSSRSPIKRSPLRVAGQSLDETIHQYLEDKAYPLAALAVFMSTIALMEWWRWARDLPPKPVLATVVAVLCWTWFFLWLPVHRRRLRQLRLGLEGERAIGEFLDNLRSKGFHVFHDVLGDGFNVDHVVIGPQGVFTVETKTLSKPVKGAAEIVYDGQNIRVGGRTPDRDPVVQGKSQGRWLAEMLEEATGKKPTVRPVVLYPGWFVVPPPVKPEVWVLNPKALPSFLENEPAILQERQVREFAVAVKQYVRNRMVTKQ